MSKSSPSAPAAPDYMGVAEEQGQQNQTLNAQQTYANRPNVSTPWGDLSYSTGSAIDPATGQPVTTWGENVSLNPSEQQSLTDQQGIQLGESNVASNLLTGLSNDVNQAPVTAPNEAAYTGAGQGIDYNPNQVDQQAQDATWNQFQNMELPLQQQQTEQTQSQLEAQGLRPGTAAYDTQMRNLQNTQYNQDQTAEDQAVLAGDQQGSTEFNEANAAQAQGFGQDFSQTGANNSEIGANLGNESSALGLSEQNAGFTSNLINGLLNGQQVSMPSFPGTTSAGAAQGANLLGAAEQQGNSELNTYNAQTGAANSGNAAEASIIGGLIAAFA